MSEQHTCMTACCDEPAVARVEGTHISRHACWTHALSLKRAVTGAEIVWFDDQPDGDDEARAMTDGGHPLGWEKRCVWSNLPKYGENRCICDSPKFQMMEECSECGAWVEVAHTVRDSEENPFCQSCDPGLRGVPAA